MVEQLSNRVMVLEANLDFVYRSLAYKQGDPMPSITTAQKNAQGLYSTAPGPSDAALAARVSASRAAQEKALQQGTSPERAVLHGPPPPAPPYFVTASRSLASAEP